uniref:Uncharacterized protein n=1 Tax=Panagrolaimus davidi TaxID=227884 RepID=A0A914QLT0_9BILA
MLPSKFYENVDPIYYKLIKDLEKDLEELEKKGNTENYKNVLIAFSENYLMPKELWDKLFRCDYHNTLTKFADHAYYQFYVSKDILTVCSLRRYQKLLNFKKTFKTNDIYPHSDLQNSLRQYEKNSCAPLSKSIIQEYNKMLNYYERIKSVEENQDEWFKALMDVGDEEFIEQNVEHRLGQNLTNKKLWMLYINYLKSRNTQVFF